MKKPRGGSGAHLSAAAELQKVQATLKSQLSQVSDEAVRLFQNNKFFDKGLFIEIKFISNELDHVGSEHNAFISKYETRLNDVLTTIERQAQASEANIPLTQLNFKYAKQQPYDKILRLIPNIRSSLAIYRNFSFEAHIDRLLAPDVPVQKPAPVRVTIDPQIGLRLTVSQTHRGSVPVPSVERLRAAAIELLGRTIEQVEGASNADPRLAPNLSGLLAYLSGDFADLSIEAIGLNYKFAERSFNITKETLPDALAEQIEQLLTTVSVILNQFDEWRLYLDAEGSTQLTPSDKENVLPVAEELTDYLAENKDFVEQGIVARISDITDTFSRGLINIDSVAVPLLTSFGNIFSELARYIISFTPESLAGLGTAGTSVLFIGFAIKTIELFFPTISNFSPLRYVFDIHKFIQKNFSFLKDVVK